MAYSQDSKPLQLTALTSLDNTDTVIVGDTSDTSEVVKSITWADIKTLLASVFQATLVSGTNIKTINSTSLLGSGDISISGSVADGDKGDITVSSSGTVWTIDNGVVTLAKQADMATASVIYRKTAGSGAPEVQTLATLKTDLGLTGTNSGDQTSIVGITGTKAQFDTAVTDGNIVYVGDDVTSAVSAASDTAAGKVELATTAETNTGTDATRAVTPDGLAGSYAGTKSLSVQVFDGATDVATGDGKAYITIPEALNGMNLVRAQATVVTAGTTNATTVMIHNKTDAQDMLSGAISIASAGTVGTVGTINTTYDDVATNDVLRIDVDSVSTTAPKGLMVVLEFRLP